MEGGPQVDWFLIIIAVVVPVVLTFINILVYRYYISEDVKGNGFCAWTSFLFVVSPKTAPPACPHPVTHLLCVVSFADAVALGLGRSCLS
jgi:hypothetical protein